MPVGRDAAAAALYRKKDREGRETMVGDASCDSACIIGYLEFMRAHRYRDLARIRRRNATTRKEQMQRKADFCHVLAQMYGTQELIQKYRLKPN